MVYIEYMPNTAALDMTTSIYKHLTTANAHEMAIALKNVTNATATGSSNLLYETIVYSLTIPLFVLTAAGTH